MSADNTHGAELAGAAMANTLNQLSKEVNGLHHRLANQGNVFVQADVEDLKRSFAAMRNGFRSMGLIEEGNEGVSFSGQRLNALEERLQKLLVHNGSLIAKLQRQVADLHADAEFRKQVSSVHNQIMGDQNKSINGLLARLQKLESLCDMPAVEPVVATDSDGQTETSGITNAKITQNPCEYQVLLDRIKEYEQRVRSWRDTAEVRQIALVGANKRIDDLELQLREANELAARRGKKLEELDALADTRGLQMVKLNEKLQAERRHFTFQRSDHRRAHIQCTRKNTTHSAYVHMSDETFDTLKMFFEELP